MVNIIISIESNLWRIGKKRTHTQSNAFEWSIKVTLALNLFCNKIRDDSFLLTYFFSPCDVFIHIAKTQTIVPLCNVTIFCSVADAFVQLYLNSARFHPFLFTSHSCNAPGSAFKKCYVMRNGYAYGIFKLLFPAFRMSFLRSGFGDQHQLRNFCASWNIFCSRFVLHMAKWICLGKKLKKKNKQTQTHIWKS